MLWDDLAHKANGAVQLTEQEELAAIAEYAIKYIPSLDVEYWLYAITVLHGIAINMLNRHWKHAAGVYTDWENHRTQKEYHNHYVWRVYVFYFINSYSYLLYVAFIKSLGEGAPALWWTSDSCARHNSVSNCERDCMVRMLLCYGRD